MSSANKDEVLALLDSARMDLERAEATISKVPQNDWALHATGHIFAAIIELGSYASHINLTQSKGGPGHG